MIPFDNYTKIFKWRTLVSKNAIEKAIINSKGSPELISGYISVYGGILVSKYNMDILSPHKISKQKFTIPLDVFKQKDFTSEGYTIYWFLNKEDLKDYYKSKEKVSLLDIKPRKEVTNIKVSESYHIKIQYDNALIIKKEYD